MIVASLRGVVWCCLLGLLVPMMAQAKERPSGKDERALAATIAVDFENQFKRCWRVPRRLDNPVYAPVHIRIDLARDGRVEGRPVVAYPLARPDHAFLAQTALRAVLQCSPLKIDRSYLALYDRWKVILIAFDPTDGPPDRGASADGIPAVAISADRTSR